MSTINKTQLVARTISDAGTAISTTYIAEALGISRKLIAALCTSLRKRRLIHSTMIEGSQELRHRVADPLAMKSYLAGEITVRPHVPEAPAPSRPPAIRTLAAELGITVSHDSITRADEA